MRKKRRTEITIETEQVVLTRPRRSAVRAWCQECAESVRMTSAEEAAALSGVTARTVYALVEAGHLHFTETPDGRLLICLPSLNTFGGGNQR